MPQLTLTQVWLFSKTEQCQIFQCSLLLVWLINFAAFNSLEEYLNVTLGGTERIFSSFDVGKTFHHNLFPCLNHVGSLLMVKLSPKLWRDGHKQNWQTISSLYRCPKSDDKHWHLHLHCWVVNFASIGSNNFWIQFMKNMFFWFYTTLIWGSEETCQIYYRLLTNIPEAQACNMILGYEKLLWRKTQSTPPHGQPCNLSRRVTILQLDSGFSCYWIRLLSSQWN